MKHDIKPIKAILTQDLNDLAVPEEMARTLRESYKNPLEELLRRKSAAREEGHHKNISFWLAVETILSPAKSPAKKS
ncbi:MAG: hypothetical protein JKY45_02660 [Emcibacter sp.]|nr:hypothetical protein [Emcibacter sp.]